MWWEVQLKLTSFQTLHKRTGNDATFHAAFLILPRCDWLVFLAPEAASAESPVVTDACVASDDRFDSTANGKLSLAFMTPMGARKEEKFCTDKIKNGKQVLGWDNERRYWTHVWYYY
mmetsp:Transcript_8389/g.52456  ORF Transcript_8389/g.52456 Transcript_8389/m.52456 type:complete len:117 (-) Transcript_8389:20-370(-)